MLYIIYKMLYIYVCYVYIYTPFARVNSLSHHCCRAIKTWFLFHFLNPFTSAV